MPRPFSTGSVSETAFSSSRRAAWSAWSFRRAALVAPPLDESQPALRRGSVVSGDRIFITGYGRAQQLRLAGDTVSVVYDIRCLRSSFNNPVLVDGDLYGSDRGTLQRIEWETGREKWSRPDALSFALPARKAEEARRNPMGEGGLIAVGRHLIILDESGYVPGGSGARGVPGAGAGQGPGGAVLIAPALANGVLYCRNNHGDLCALDLRDWKEKGTAVSARRR